MTFGKIIIHSSFYARTTNCIMIFVESCQSGLVRLEMFPEMYNFRNAAISRFTLRSLMCVFYCVAYYVNAEFFEVSGTLLICSLYIWSSPPPLLSKCQYRVTLLVWPLQLGSWCFAARHETVLQCDILGTALFNKWDRLYCVGLEHLFQSGAVISYRRFCEWLVPDLQVYGDEGMLGLI